MAKTKKAYFCRECGFEAPKWLGKCPACGEWNSFTEEIISKQSGSSDGWTVDENLIAYKISGQNKNLYTLYYWGVRYKFPSSQQSCS